MSSPNKRREMDLYKLMMTDFQVELEDDSVSTFEVEFQGPKGSPYEEGTWLVRVELPEAYPYKSPSIGFVNRIFHPNIDESGGSVCLDVINQTWSPMFDLVNIFETFLPQLLLYPNAADPLNGQAAAMYMSDRKAYEKIVRAHVNEFASRQALERLKGGKRGGGGAGSGAPLATGVAEPQTHDGEGGNEEDGDEEREDDFLSDSSEEEDGVEL